MNRTGVTALDGPLILACNHPNSFLDAVILDIVFEKPIWSLARGDVFKKPVYIKLLTKLKMLPVYRTSEGVENLETNYKTFDACKEIFKKKGLVLMFSEGRCINEWHLRPLKKGTARLALSAWKDGIDVKVLPVGINYSSFRRFGKNIFLNFGNIISKNDIDAGETEGKQHLSFNSKLRDELGQLVFEIPNADKSLQKKILYLAPLKITKILLFIPAITGFVLNAPLYLPVRAYTWSRTKDNDHYDSVVIAMLVFLYPLYLLLLSLILFFLTNNWLSFLAFLFVPFVAWTYVSLKGQLDK